MLYACKSFKFTGCEYSIWHEIRFMVIAFSQQPKNKNFVQEKWTDGWMDVAIKII